jgi:hypothetical protein
MDQITQSSGLPKRIIGEDALAVLQSHDWPGNVRQLRNNVERLMILAGGEPGSEITAGMLPADVGASPPSTSGFGGEHLLALPLREAREAFERDYVAAQLSRFGGNISRTSQFVGMERSALHRKIKLLGLAIRGDGEEVVALLDRIAFVEQHLRQQLGILKRKMPRPRLRTQDRIFWILLRRLWPAWRDALVIVKPETVVAWHRAGFRLFWRLRSRPKSLGRPRIDAEVRTLIRRMVNENPSWGAPRIHGELLKLGFEVSERTVSRYLRRLSPPDAARKRWATFLRNHREVITAMDFFTVPTLSTRKTS